MTIFLLAAVGVMLLAAVLALVYATGLQVALNNERQKNARQETMLAGRRQDVEEATAEIAHLRGVVADLTEENARLIVRLGVADLELEKLDGMIAEAIVALAQPAGGE